MAVFVSYARHGEPLDGAVLQLAQELLKNGVAADIDQFHAHPPEGWYKWMEHAVEDAERVLIVPSPKYAERFSNRAGTPAGAAYEGALLSASLFAGGVSYEKYGIVLMSSSDVEHIPLILKGCPRYEYPAGFVDLLRWLTGQPAIVKEPLGETPVLPPVGGVGASVTDFVDLCVQMIPIMKRNKLLFERFGPNSGPGDIPEIRWDTSLWEAMKRRHVVPNNAHLLSLVEKNHDKIPVDLAGDFERLVAHLHAFAAHAEYPELDYRSNQFPAGFEERLEAIVRASRG